MVGIGGFPLLQAAVVSDSIFEEGGVDFFSGVFDTPISPPKTGGSRSFVSLTHRALLLFVSFLYHGGWLVAIV